MFAVKVCNVAIIGLMTSDTANDNMYEIVIYESNGIDVRNKYYDSGAVVAKYSEKNLIACDEFRHFIIGWTNGITIQTYTDSSWRILLKMNSLPNYFVNYLAIRTKSKAHWIISHQGKIVLFHYLICKFCTKILILCFPKLNTAKVTIGCLTYYRSWFSNIL